MLSSNLLLPHFPCFRTARNASLSVDGKVVGKTQSSGSNRNLNIAAPFYLGTLFLFDMHSLNSGSLKFDSLSRLTTKIFESFNYYKEMLQMHLFVKVQGGRRQVRSQNGQGVCMDSSRTEMM